MENDISEKLIWGWCGRWIGLAKTQGEKSSLQINKGHGKCGKERANFRGLALNGMKGKKEKNIRNDPKVLRLSGRKLKMRQQIYIEHLCEPGFFTSAL